MLDAKFRVWYFAHGIPYSIIDIIERGLDGEKLSRRDASKATSALRASIEQFPDTEVLPATLGKF